MKEKTIDNFLEQKRQQVFLLHSVECTSEQIEQENDMDRYIYKCISEEALTLKDDGKYNYRVSKTKNTEKLKTRIKLFCRKIDRKMKQSELYNNYIRKVLKKCYHKLRNHRKKVNLLKILQGSNNEAVNNMYRYILDREPDPEGLSYNINKLETHQSSRWEMACAFNNSEEIHSQKKLKCVWRARILYGRK